MGLASFIVGILAIFLSWIPCLWPIVVVHVIIGLALGISDIVFVSRNNMQGPHPHKPVPPNASNFAKAGICMNLIGAFLTVTWQLFWNTQGFGLINW